MLVSFCDRSCEPTLLQHGYSGCRLQACITRKGVLCFKSKAHVNPNEMDISIKILFNNGHRKRGLYTIIEEVPMKIVQRKFHYK